MPGNRNCLVIFTKNPQPGLVKKRLIPALGKNDAASVYQKMTERMFSIAHSLENIDVQVWIAHDKEFRFANSIKDQYGFDCYEQTGAGLGERMFLAMSVNQDKYEAIVLTGCDCPTLSAGILAEAFTQLEAGIDAVIGPAWDGGYYLIGFRKVHASVFEDIQWGSESVAASTRDKLTALGIQWHELPVLRDIDRPEDLEILNY